MFLIAVICGVLDMLGWVHFGVSVVVLLLTLIAAGLLFGGWYDWELPTHRRRSTPTTN
jgi:hypothetical protein